MTGVAPNIYDREVRFDEFRQRVRRHSPSTLLPVLAARARDKVQRASWFERPAVETPWALAAAARVSLIYGSEHRPAAAHDDVLPICAAFAAIKLLRRSASTDELRAFLLRTNYEQMTYQLDIGYDVARSVAMFRDSLEAINPTTLTPEALEDALGRDVVDFVGVGWLLFASAMFNSGQFQDAWIDAPQFQDVVRDLPKARLRELIARSFAADVTSQRADALANMIDCRRDPQRERFAYNPLSSRPLVALAPGSYVIPSPLLLLRRVTTTGIYYAAMGRFGPTIGQDLGATFEHYVGRQLAQMPDVRLVAEVTYNRGGSKTVDWFAIFNDLLVLVEVKAPRLTEAARMGDAELAHDLDRTIGAARRQIDRTAALVTNGATELIASGVPLDRPVRGLVVTLEPYFMVQSRFLAELLPDALTPATVASVHDLEHMVAVARAGVSLPEQLSRLQDDPELATWSPVAALRSAWPDVRGDNPILDAASDELPWRDQIAGDG